MKRSRGEAVGVSAKRPIDAGVASTSKAGAEHAEKRLRLAASSELYETLSRNERTMDKAYVKELGTRHSSLKWNWFVGRLVYEDRLGYTCPMRHVDGKAALINRVKRSGGATPHTWNKAALLLNLAGIAGPYVKAALTYIRVHILGAEFEIIKKVLAQKAAMGVARRHGVFGAATEQLKQTGFMVKPKFVTERTLLILEEMNKEYLANVDSGMSSPLAPCLLACYN